MSGMIFIRTSRLKHLKWSKGTDRQLSRRRDNIVVYMCALHYICLYEALQGLGASPLLPSLPHVGWALPKVSRGGREERLRRTSEVEPPFSPINLSHPHVSVSVCVCSVLCWVSFDPTSFILTPLTSCWFLPSPSTTHFTIWCNAEENLLTVNG